MSGEKWQEIGSARRLLGLGEKATLREIKQAYRRLAKAHHPDTANAEQAESERLAMHELTAACQALVAHCENYPVPLVQQQADEPLDCEEWWMDRFGHDPLWGKGGS